MKRKEFTQVLPAVALLASAAPSPAQELQAISLPKPEKDGGKSVMAVMAIVLRMVHSHWLCCRFSFFASLADESPALADDHHFPS